MFGIAYFVWTVGIAAALYAIVRAADDHFSQAKRTLVSHWLKERDAGMWAAYFAYLFDYTFGPRHFSRRRILASAISSIVTILALWVLFGPVLHLMDSRADIPMPLTRIIALGVAINLVADYFSLMETRWLLGRFEHVRNWFLQIGLLLADLVFSALIILVTIALSRWLQGERLLSPIELMAGYTPYAIFFYSTFLTSIWAWAFFASAGIIRIFARTPLGKLDIEKRPFTQIGLVAGFLTFGVLMGGKALTDRYMPDDLDDWICGNFGGYSCTHAARLSDDDLKAIERLKRACTTGDALQCRTIIDGLDDELTAEAAPILNAACKAAGDASACNSLGYMYDQTLGVAQDYPRARGLYEQACEGGKMSGCNNLGGMYRNALGVTQDYPRARGLFEQACEGGEMSGCYNLGVMIYNGEGGTKDIAAAKDLFQQACDGGNAQACDALDTIAGRGE